MSTDLTNLCIGQNSSIRDAIAQMDLSRTGIVLVVGDAQNLLGTITDGDVRRAMLANIGLDEPVSVILAQKSGSPYAQPIAAQQGTDRATILHMLRQHNIRHLPIVDQDHRLVAMATLDEFVAEQEPAMQAVIMAGGLGLRMRPLTEDMPKPMLPVGGRPLMEHMIQRLREAGIKQVNIAVHHKSEKIIEHFGDGRDFGLEITYVTEDRPLGTAGALGLMESPKDTILVINGDVLTDVDFRVMLEYHREQHADLTVAVQRYNLQVPYGVVECEGTLVRRLVEKPRMEFLVNAGIYLLEPRVCSLIPQGDHWDMTDTIQNLIDEGRPVAVFPIHEYWKDIGEQVDYEQAQEDVRNWGTHR